MAFGFRRRFRQRGRRNFRRRRFFRKRNNPNAQRGLIKLNPRREIQAAFPPQLITKLTCYMESGTSGSGANANVLCYRLNGFGDGHNNTNGCGARAGYGGNYSTAYPTGLTYLLSSSGSGALPNTRPYVSYIVTGAKWMARVLPVPVTGANIPAPYVKIAFIPTQGDTAWSNVTGISTYEEQAGVKTIIIPVAQTALPANNVSGSNQVMVPRWYKGYIDNARIQGISKASYLADPNFYGTEGADLAAIYRNTLIAAVTGDGTNAYNVVIQMKVTYYVKFLSRGGILSSAQTVV